LTEDRPINTGLALRAPKGATVIFLMVVVQILSFCLSVSSWRCFSVVRVDITPTASKLKRPSFHTTRPPRFRDEEQEEHRNFPSGQKQTIFSEEEKKQDFAFQKKEAT
jgi:hypothetical protein